MTNSKAKRNSSLRFKSKHVGLISKKEITKVARQTVFEKQKDSKIRAEGLLFSFFLLMACNKNSYADWASILSSKLKKTVSKQAIFSRMNKKWVALVKQLVEKVLSEAVMSTSYLKVEGVFNNIWLQDSTCLSLPDCLKYIFPGNISRGKQKAVAKVNAIVNAVTGVCANFDIVGYNISEQELSDRIFEVAKSGDLVLRDLGYAVLSVFQKMEENGIFYISRLKFGIHIFNPKTKAQLSLVSILKNKSCVDIPILCGKKDKVAMRLIAIKLCPKQVKERIRKAKKDRDKRLNHSTEYYYCLGYSIFITNIKKEKCDTKQIAELYGVRWQIEIMFKSWKSGVGIEKTIPEAECKTERIESMLYMIMLYIAWYEQKIVAPLMLIEEGDELADISQIKLSNQIKINVEYYLTNELSRKKIRELQYFCKYEKRKRTNARQRLSNCRDNFN